MRAVYVCDWLKTQASFGAVYRKVGVNSHFALIASPYQRVVFRTINYAFLRELCSLGWSSLCYIMGQIR